jgi:hypothetical protein
MRWSIEGTNMKEGVMKIKEISEDMLRGNPRQHLLT